MLKVATGTWRYKHDGEEIATAKKKKQRTKILQQENYAHLYFFWTKKQTNQEQNKGDKKQAKKTKMKETKKKDSKRNAVNYVEGLSMYVVYIGKKIKDKEIEKRECV